MTYRTTLQKKAFAEGEATGRETGIRVWQVYEYGDAITEPITFVNPYSGTPILNTEWRDGFQHGYNMQIRESIIASIEALVDGCP